MCEINALPWNGFNVASTFSGCGGSSLGYKMAGFKVLYASEFIPEAQETYRQNHRNTYLDDRDIRKVSGCEILDKCGLNKGELDILDGSPPCASFSLSGSREAHWGKVKTYSDTKQRVDDLFYEYIRLIEDIQPRVFIAENVRGLVVGKAKGYFLDILEKMKASGYRVKAKILDAKFLGVPQSRQRTIFIGVRNDLCIDPCFPLPLRYVYTVRDALSNITHIRLGSKGFVPSNIPSPTIVQSDSTSSITAKFSCGGFCIDDISIEKYAIGQEWLKLKPGEKSSKYQNLYRSNIDMPCPTVTASGGSISAASVTHPSEPRKYTIPELKRICGFPDDFILTGTFKQQWERLGRAVPPVMMSHIARAVLEGVLVKCKKIQ